MYMRALEGKEKALRRDHTSTYRIVNNLGILYSGQGKLEEAEQMYLRALAGYEKALGPDHTSTLGTVNNLGMLYRNQGKLAKLIQLLSTWGSRRINLFGLLGRTLLQILDDPNAQSAFRQEITFQFDVWVYTNIQCDGCGLPITCQKKRLVCRQCADGDLCGECWNMQQSGATTVATCIDHDFLEISSETASHLEKEWTTRERDRSSWLHGLTVKYQDS